MGSREKLEMARRIVQLLEQRGHIILTTHLFSDTVHSDESKNTAEHVYERDMIWLHECDAVIAEVSSSSFGIGYEAGYVLGSSGKKVCLLYDKSMEEKVSRMARGNTHPNCVRVPYSNYEEIERFIEENF